MADDYTITFSAHPTAALGALADAAERCGWPELSLALRAAVIHRSEYPDDSGPGVESIVLGSDNAGP